MAELNLTKNPSTHEKRRCVGAPASVQKRTGAFPISILIAVEAVKSLLTMRERKLYIIKNGVWGNTEMHRDLWIGPFLDAAEAPDLLGAFRQA